MCACVRCQARSATKQSLDVQREQRNAVQEHDKRLTASEDQRTLSHAVAQERNIQARHEARRAEQLDTANHNLQAIRAKEAAKRAEKEASLAQDRANNADGRELGCQRWHLPRPGLPPLVRHHLRQSPPRPLPTFDTQPSWIALDGRSVEVWNGPVGIHQQRSTRETRFCALADKRDLLVGVVLSADACEVFSGQHHDCFWSALTPSITRTATL